MLCQESLLLTPLVLILRPYPFTHCWGSTWAILLYRSKRTAPLLFWTPHWPGARLRPAKLKPDAVAVIHPQRRILVTLSGKLEQELKRMEDLGVTVRVTEPIDWVNSIATPGKQRREI